MVSELIVPKNSKQAFSYVEKVAVQKLVYDSQQLLPEAATRSSL